MKTSLAPEIERCRMVQHDYEKGITGPMGRFMLVHPKTGRTLMVISSGISTQEQWDEMKLPGPPWEHVSVSAKFGMPMWIEMCWVKEHFWNDDEWVIQFHPSKAEHVNIHEYCLHLWRCPSAAIPTPPKECV